jgi:NADH-quinone oxidoreductase subunit N
MAYSSIGNMGYALLGVLVGNEQGATAAVIYMIIYMVMAAGVFGIILCMRRGGRSVEAISDLAGLSRSSPLMAYGLAILLFSMAGIPPMAGFFGKLMVFQAAVAAGFYGLAVVGVVTSVIAAYYYLRVIKVMFFDEAAEPLDAQMAFAKRAVVLLSVVFVLFFILKPNMLVDMARHTANVLFVG